MVQLSQVIVGFISILIGVLFVPIIATNVTDAGTSCAVVNESNPAQCLETVQQSTPTTILILALIPILFGIAVLINSIRLSR